MSKIHALSSSVHLDCLPDADVFLKQEDKVELSLLHLAPLREVHHVGAEEDDEAQQHQLCRILKQETLSKLVNPQFKDKSQTRCVIMKRPVSAACN